ncbi:MAG TPA: hypothetical protein VFR31_00165 [Thermoanaerobaculia bacterium]|nr:hypothetical protein [Thermoanaerobaculia bacterium]
MNVHGMASFYPRLNGMASPATSDPPWNDSSQRTWAGYNQPNETAIDAPEGGASMIAGMSPAARSQGIKNALVVGIVSLGVFWLAALGFSVVLGRSWSESLLFALAALVGAVYLSCLWSWFRGRRQAGSVLLDCGPSATRRESLLSAAWFLVLGVAMTLGLSSSGFMEILGLFCILQAIVMTLLAVRHIQFREHGLWDGMSLLPWDKIESYWWDGGRTLMLATKRRRWLLKKGAILVPAELRESVDRLLGTMMRG